VLLNVILRLFLHTKPVNFDPLAFCEGLTKLLRICEVGSSIHQHLRQNCQQNSLPWLSRVYSEVNAGLSRDV